MTTPVVTVTLNPALDRTITVDKLVLGRVRLAALLVVLRELLPQTDLVVICAAVRVESERSKLTGGSAQFKRENV